MSVLDFWRCRLIDLLNFGSRKFKALVEHAMEGAEKAELLLAMKFNPADSFHVFEDLSQPRSVVDLDLPKQRGIAVERQVWQSGDQKMLIKQEILDGLARVVRVVNQDEREDGDPRKGVGN